MPTSPHEPAGGHAPSPPAEAAVLRPARPGDVAAVARIWGEGWVDAHLGHVPAALVAARTPTSFAERARDRVVDTIVAERHGAVVGFVMLDEDQVDHLYLDRAARGGASGRRCSTRRSGP